MRLAGHLISLGPPYLLRGPLADPSQSSTNRAGVLADRSLFESMVTSTWKDAKKFHYVGIESTAETRALLGPGSKTRAMLGLWRLRDIREDDRISSQVECLRGYYYFVNALTS